MYLLQNDTHEPVAFQKTLRTVVGITCFFSIIGSILIILSYLLLRDMRTNARLILVHLSLADLGVGMANLFGDAVPFNSLQSTSMGDLCKVQAFVAHFCTISSVLWTMMLAVFMYTVITKMNHVILSKKNWKFMIFACIFSYGIPLLITIWMICTNKLGFAPSDTSGWCGGIIIRPRPQIYYEDHIHYKYKDYMAAIFGYDLWIVLTCVVIMVIYGSLHCYVRQERAKSDDFKELIKRVDYKFILIPVAFILLRMWSFLENVFFVYSHFPMRDNPHYYHLHLAINFIAGIGDSGQGAVNAILFVAFTRNIRLKFLYLFCRCFSKKPEIKEPNRLTDRTSLSDEDEPLINKYGGFSTTSVNTSSKTKKKQTSGKFPASWTSTSSIASSLNEDSLSD